MPDRQHRWMDVHHDAIRRRKLPQPFRLGAVEESAIRAVSCPNCDASYMVVQVQAAPSTLYRQITCRSCDSPLDAQKGRYILKYFLLRERPKTPAELGRKYLG